MKAEILGVLFIGLFLGFVSFSYFKGKEARAEEPTPVETQALTDSDGVKWKVLFIEDHKYLVKWSDRDAQMIIHSYSCPNPIHD